MTNFHFWMDWWVQAVVAVGTLGAVVAAIYAEKIRAKLFKPKLRVRLVQGYGVGTPATLTSPDGSTRVTGSRWRHVEAVNDVTWPVARRAQVCLTRLESPGPDGELKIRWLGAIPIRWRFQEIEPLVRMLGPSHYADLCSVVQGKWLEIHPIITPNNLQTRWLGATDIVVTLQLRSEDGVSPERRFRISWDGNWHDGDIEMANHLVVRELGDIAAS